MPDNYIFNSDFTRYKKAKPIIGFVTLGDKKHKSYDIISSADVSQQEISDYAHGKELHIKNGNLYPRFQTFDPNVAGEHGYMFCCLLIGEHGSGKTTMAAKLAKIWRKQNKKSEGNIFLISTQNDECISKLNPIRINCTNPSKIEENFLDPETMVRFVDENDESEFENGLVIVDDLEGLQSPSGSAKEKKAILDAIYTNIINPILFTGRHHNCSIIIIRHGMNLTKPEERAILNESDFIGLFPHKSAPQRIRYILERYCCLPKKYVEKVVSLNSRYLIHHNRYPSVTICEHDILQHL